MRIYFIGHHAFGIRGKEYLGSQAKYYVVDLGFIRSQLHKQRINRGAKLENAVYLYLKSLGFEVFVGSYDNKKIDFVASKADQTIYVQVTDHIPEHSQRETENLLHLPTGYRKIVVTNNWSEAGEIDGLPIVYAPDLLSGKISLD